MSNRRRPAHPAASALDALAGRRIPGGCDDCDAFQTMTLTEGVYMLTVHHDESCPWLNGRTS